MKPDPRLVRALLACYPPMWRRRYGDEYAQLLCDLRVHRRPALIFDSLRGAARAHGGVLMSTRSPLTIAVWATGLFAVAGVGFQKLAEDFTGVAGRPYWLVVVAAAVALLALVIAVVPAAVQLLHGRDPRAWRYVAVPIVGAAAWYGVVRLALAVSHGRAVHSPANIVAFALVATMGIAVMAATAWAASTAINRLLVTESKSTKPVALFVLAAGMGVASVAALIWGLQVRTNDPNGFHGDHGVSRRRSCRAGSSRSP